jgi:hypothetical protein
MTAAKSCTTRSATLTDVRTLPAGVSFDPDGDGTLVTVSHSKFETAHVSDAHGAGWAEALERLAQRPAPPA